MPQYPIRVVERLFKVGTITVEASTPEEAEETARDQIPKDYDAASWGDAEREELETTAEEADDSAGNDSALT